MTRTPIYSMGLIVTLAGTVVGSGLERSRLVAALSSQPVPESSPHRETAPSTVIALLTEEERAWLGRHPVIRVAQDPGWPPVEFADARGEPAGISEDYIRLVEQRLGITFERVRGLDWQEAFARLKRWDLDMTPCVAETPARREYWAFTKPYTRIPIVIATQANVTYIADMRALAERKVAVVDGYIAVEHLARDYPEIQLVKTKTVKEGLDLLQRGEVFAVVDNMLVLSYYMAQLKLANLKIAGETPYVNAQAMAVRKDWAILAGILQKALESVSEAERSAIYQKWVPVRYEHGFDYTRLWQVLAVFGAVVAAMGVWVHRLTSEIRRRKAAEVSATISESLLRIAGRTARFGGWSVTIADKQVVWSDEVASIHGKEPGYSPSVDEAIGFYAPEWRERITRVFGECAGAGTPYDEEMEIITARGDRVWVRAIGEAVRDDSGAIVRVQGSFQDITDRKQGEILVHQAELRYRNFVSNATEGIYRIDFIPPVPVDLSDAALVERLNQSAIVGEVNDALARMYGLTQADMIGRPATDFAPAYGERAVLAVKAPDRQVRDQETVDVDSAGRAINLIENYTGIVEDGRLIHMWGMQRDVTDRKRADQALRDSEERYRTLVLAAFEGIVVSTGGRLVDCNDRFVQLSGYERDELFKMDPINLIAPEHRDRVLSSIGGGQEPFVEHALVRKDGRRVIVEAHVREIDYGGRKLRLSAIRDLTDRREAEARYAQIVATTLSGFWLTDLTGRLLDVNDAICRMLGYSREELLAMSVADVEAAETAEQVLGHISALGRTGRDRFESRHRRKDGTVIDVEISTTLLDIGEGQAVSFIEDITERKRAEATLQGQLLELRRWHGVTLGRERRIQELKGEVNQLLGRLNEPARYPSVESGIIPPQPSESESGRAD